ncbi:MAG TPA: IS21 family transposase [Solirubrobacteraceae bacterium]|nr:IS21 family transposase [Solirubrobacteraceae bacterium]
MEQWAELRREHFVAGKSIKRLVGETGLSKNTIRRALRSETPPTYQRAGRGSVLEEFKPEIHRLLREDPKLTGVRVRELLEPLGCTAGKTIVDDYLREVRPLFSPPPRTFPRGVWRPGEFCQFDVWEPREPVAVGHGQTRRGWVVVGCLAYSRVGAGVLVFSKQTEDLLAGISGCLTRLGVLPQKLLWDRQAGIHAHHGRPTDAFAAFCGQLRVGWRFCNPADPQAKGTIERLQEYMETNFEPGRQFANQLDFQDQLDQWFVKANGRVHKTLRQIPNDRLALERQGMRPVPAVMPDVALRWVTRVSPDPYLRVDTNDYSLHPAFVGRQVEVRVDQDRILAGVLDTGEVVANHARVFAKHRTITALEHARAHRDQHHRLDEQIVEVRPLARYDALIA